MTQPTTIDLPDFQIGDEAILNGIVIRLIGQPTSTNHTPSRLGHTCRYGADCRRFDLQAIDPRDDAQIPGTAWDCQLRARITEGQHLDCPAGDTMVRVFCSRPDAAYHVLTGHVGPIAGYLDQFELVESFTSEPAARAYARQLVIGLREIATITATDSVPVRLAPPAKGTATRVTAPQLRILQAAGPAGAHITRGAGATDPQLRAMARRGLINLTTTTVGRRTIVTGGTVTPAGREAAQAA